MVLKPTKFTPETLLEAPRRSAGVPNPTGTYALFTVSTYSFRQHVKTTELKLLDIRTGDAHVLAKDDEISDINWLNDDEFICLQAEKDDTTSIYWSSISQCLKEVELGKSHYIAGKIAGPASNLKIARTADHEYAFTVSAEANPDGTLYDGKTKSFHSSGKLYDNLYVRHWDRYETRERNSLWYGVLQKKDGKYSSSDLTNALKDTPLEAPIRPFGGADHFDICHNRIIFVAKDPELNPALNTKCNLYVLTVDSWLDPPTRLSLVQVGAGAKTSPVFAPDGTKAAFLGMEINGYEADQNRIFVLFEIHLSGQAQVLSEGEHTFWNLSPQSLAWSSDGKTIYATIEDNGHSKLFSLPLRPDGKVAPRVLTQTASVSDVKPLANGSVFTSGSSLIDNSLYQIIDTSEATALSARQIWSHSNTATGGKFGLHSKQISSIWTPASNPNINKNVHSWVVRPSTFDKSKRYPVAYLIHGGPQGSWNDSWSTRWNPAVFAEQGYIVITPNPTGSTGYGQQFTNAINKNWGGDPYQDIVNVFNWVTDNMPEADNEKAVALGASYGGYMMNWIQGHDLGRKFKALVCHDGIFSTASMLATEELYFPFFDLGGTPFYNPDDSQLRLNLYKDWRQWDPAEHLANWATPQLIIHSAKDFRICIAEGLAAFNVLQARKVDSQFLTFPDENHWVLKPENSLLWHKVVFNFINKYVGLPAYTNEATQSAAFYGGIKEGDAAPASMPTQGKPET